MHFTQAVPVAPIKYFEGSLETLARGAARLRYGTGAQGYALMFEIGNSEPHRSF